VTLKLTPASAELLVVVCLELSVTSVSNPITAEGRTTKTLPEPLLVLMPATAVPMHCPEDVVQELVPSGLSVQLCWQVNPPEIAPFESMVQATGFAPFPLVA
jgi:hypothetical protein